MVLGIIPNTKFVYSLNPAVAGFFLSSSESISKMTKKGLGNGQKENKSRNKKVNNDYKNLKYVQNRQ